MGETWREMRHYNADGKEPLCYWCGESCSGDTTVRLDVDGMPGEVAVCDPRDGPDGEEVGC